MVRSTWQARRQMLGMWSLLGLALSGALPATVSAQALTPEAPAFAASAGLPTDAVYARAHAEVKPFLSSLQALVGIESGSQDLEGLDRAAAWVHAQLQQAGMQVQTLPAHAPAKSGQGQGARVGSMVLGRLQGQGQKKVLLIAHMDTVYPRGMAAQQPFRIEDGKAYGLAIADDKSGVALILHTVRLLQAMDFRDYAELAVLINGDEEIGSPGSRALLTQLGSEFDAVLSYESGGGERDIVRLATSALASVEMTVTGRAAHAGANPQAGRNALYEMAHQVLKSRQFGDPARGLRIQWTVARSGEVRNVIPESAVAWADVRADHQADMDAMEQALRTSIQDKLLPDTQITLNFQRGRPAFVANEASRAMARHAQSLFQAMQWPLQVAERPLGGGTDAAYAALRARGGVLEGMGLRGYGAHANQREYIHLASIAPRLYLSTRMVMDIGSGQVRW